MTDSCSIIIGAITIICEKTNECMISLHCVYLTVTDKTWEYGFIFKLLCRIAELYDHTFQTFHCALQSVYAHI